MIVDFHVHIFPPQIKEHREQFFEDKGFSLLYSSKDAKLINVEELIDAMDENAIDKSVVFGFPWEKESSYKMHNDYILESVNRFPNRLIGLCCLNPLTNNPEKEVVRCLDSGLKGVGEIAFYGSDITQELVDSMSGIMDILRERDALLLLHTNEPVGHIYPGKSPMSLSGLYMFLKRFPDNRIILAHWGGGLFFYALMKKEVKDVLRNVWFDTAASPYLYRKDIYPVASYIIGSKKILFGSDYPLISPVRYLKEIEDSGMAPDQIRDIVGQNAIEVLGCVT